MMQVSNSQDSADVLARVLTIVSECLQSDDISPSANFFELGGDSLAMVTCLLRFQEEFGTDLPPDLFFTSSSLEDVGSAIVALSCNAS